MAKHVYANYKSTDTLFWMVGVTLGWLSVLTFYMGYRTWKCSCGGRVAVALYERPPIPQGNPPIMSQVNAPYSYKNECT